MQTNYEVLELFPTPVFTTTIPLEYSKVVPWFYTQEMLSEEIDSPNYGERSKDAYILDKPECLDLKAYLLTLTKTYGDMLGYDYESYRFGQSWLSYKHPGQHHSMHSHPNSLISGVFYYGEIDINTPGIGFLQTEAPQTYCMLSPKYKNDIKPQYEPHMLSTYPGTLFLFPSYLMHFVPPNTSNIPRKSLAFNIIPSDGFGEDRTLNYLNINNDLK